MLLLVALSVAASLVPAVITDDSEQSQCLDPKVSSFRVSLRNLKNASGQWSTQVVFKRRQPGADWLADVDQNVLTCEGQESALETIINLEAPPKGSNPRCVSDVTIVPTKQPVTAKEAPKDYQLFPGVGYYKFHAEPLTWPEARKVCTVEGGHLIILNSQQENDVAVTIYALHPNSGAWFLTGILEFGVHAEWFTLFGEPLDKSGYSLIYPGENNALGPSDFGAMHRTGRYADVNGAVKCPFICEVELL